jgi:hypothetical protein
MSENEGGLGIRNIKAFNVAFLGKYVMSENVTG